MFFSLSYFVSGHTWTWTSVWAESRLTCICGKPSSWFCLLLTLWRDSFLLETFLILSRWAKPWVFLSFVCECVSVGFFPSVGCSVYTLSVLKDLLHPVHNVFSLTHASVHLCIVLLYSLPLTSYSSLHHWRQQYRYANRLSHYASSKPKTNDIFW